MKNKTMKKEIRIFNVAQYAKEAEYLREMHKSGWKFVKVSGFCYYTFEACEPEDVIYQLDYNTEAPRDEYIQMFTDCGWEYLQDYVGYSYFRKRAADMTGGEEEIFCDDDSRLDMMKRIFKGRLLVLLPMFILMITWFSRYLSDRNYGISFLMGVVLTMYVFVYGYFAYQYFKLKNSRG